VKRYTNGVKRQLQISNSNLFLQFREYSVWNLADVVRGVRLSKEIVVINGVVVTNEP
jgi:hypothetical protein